MSTLARLAAEGNAICDVGALTRALASFVSTIYALYSDNNSDFFVSIRT